MEIERKFLLKTNEFLKILKLKNYSIYKIEQAYLSIDNNEIRIRKIEDINGYCEYFETIKSNGFQERKEIEFIIPKIQFEQLIDEKMYIGNIIYKFRYKIPLKKQLFAEVDVYSEQLNGLFIVEVEFKNKIEACNFQVPTWFGNEITNDPKYKNKNLIF